MATLVLSTASAFSEGAVIIENCTDLQKLGQTVYLDKLDQSVHTPKHEYHQNFDVVGQPMGASGIA